MAGDGGSPLGIHVSVADDALGDRISGGRSGQDAQFKGVGSSRCA